MSAYVNEQLTIKKVCSVTLASRPVPAPTMPPMCGLSATAATPPNQPNPSAALPLTHIQCGKIECDRVTNDFPRRKPWPLFSHVS